MTGAEARIRIDKWLWQARFFKTRSLAARAASSGQLRVNAVKIAKPAHAVGPGDTLTFLQGARVRVVCIRACGTRRGPAPEAQALYDDLSPPPPPPAEARAPGFDGGGRPTKKDRRRYDQTRRRPLE